jgi:hypothetical protein
MIVILIALAFLYFFVFNTSSITVKCNSDEQDACKMYNQRDIQTKCTSMCNKLNPKYIFNGQYTKNDNEHICGCSESPEQFTLDFTNVGENPDILPDIVPDDSKFSNRDYLEKTEEKRYHSLIFG